jgi:hypothetical protein
MTDPFRDQMRRLLGLRFAPADMVTHWEALQDVPLPVLTRAVSHAQQTRVAFPTPAELRQDCDVVASQIPHAPAEDRGADLPAPVTLGTLPTGAPVIASRVWRYYCADCSDSGYRAQWCGESTNGRKPWQGSSTCDRHAPHEGHEWVQRCACYDSNPALVRKREIQRKFADAVTTKRARGRDGY